MKRLIVLIVASLILDCFTTDAQVQLKTPREIYDYGLRVYENLNGQFGYKVKPYNKPAKTYIKACFDEADIFVRIKNSYINDRDDLLLAVVRCGTQWLIIDNAANIRYTSKSGAPKPIVDEYVHYVAEDIDGNIIVGNPRFHVTKQSDKFVCVNGNPKEDEPRLCVLHKSKEPEHYDVYKHLVPSNTYLASKISYYSKNHFLLDSTFNIMSEWPHANYKGKHHILLNKDKSGFVLIKDKFFPIKFRDTLNCAWNDYTNLVNSTHVEDMEITCHKDCYTHHENNGTRVLYTSNGKRIGKYDYSISSFDAKDGLIKTSENGKYGFIDLKMGYMVEPIIPGKKPCNGRFRTNAGYDIVISCDSYPYNIERNNIETISEYEDRLYNSIKQDLPNLDNGNCSCGYAIKGFSIAEIYLNDTMLKREEKSHFDELTQEIEKLRKIVEDYDKFKRKNEYSDGRYRFVNKSKNNEEHDIINGNYYTYEIKKKNGFLFRQCDVLNKDYFIFDFDGKYTPLKTGCPRDSSSIIIPYNEFIYKDIPDYDDLILQKYYCEHNNIFLIYDYEITREIVTGRFLDITHVAPNPETGKFEPVYGWKKITNTLDESQRFVSIVNQNGVKRTFTIPGSGYIHRKGNDIVVVDDNNIMCIDFYTGKINLLYNNEEGTKIYDVGRTTDGKYVCVGTTTNKGYVGSLNPYVILLDKNGKKLDEIHIADKDMKISKISFGAAPDEFIITCSNRPDPRYAKDNIEMTEWYEGNINGWYYEDYWGNEGFEECDNHEVPFETYNKILKVNNDKTLTFVEPDHKWLVGTWTYKDRDITFYGNGQSGKYKNRGEGTYNFVNNKIRVNEGFEYTFDGYIELEYLSDIKVCDNLLYYDYRDNECYTKTK